MSECNCKICQDHRRWITVLNPEADKAKNAVLDEIFGRLEGAETDATYYRMKLDGSWDRIRGVIPEPASSPLLPQEGKL